MIVQGMEDSFTAGMRIGLLERLTLHVIIFYSRPKNRDRRAKTGGQLSLFA
jgi:hypothetical protein